MMGKRSNFARRDKDFYPTPYEAVVPLLNHLMPNTTFIEPCFGEGDLIRHLKKHDHICHSFFDLPYDARVNKYTTVGATCFITNPPWDRKLLHPIIDNLRSQLPTYLLFDAGWMFTKQAVPYLKYCSKIITVGRVKWIPDSLYGSLDDSCWYMFHKDPVYRTDFFSKYIKPEERLPITEH